MSGLQALLMGLSNQIGHPLALDESGQCALEFSEDRLLVIAPLDEFTVSIRVELLDLSLCGTPDQQKALLCRAMSLNYSQARPGLWLAWCEAANSIALLGVFNREGDPQDFVDAVEVLLGESLSARAELRRLLDAAPTPQAPEPLAMPVINLRG